MHVSVTRSITVVRPWLGEAGLQRAVHSGPAGTLQGLIKCAPNRSSTDAPNKLALGQQGSFQHTAAGSTATAQHTREQHDPLQQQPQQQRLPSQEASLPGTQLVGAHGDKESYQGPLGGTVTVPKKCTPLWRAAFYGNVPTQWWLDKSSSSMGTAGVHGAGAVELDSKSASSSMTHRCTISSWSDLVAQSAFIQQAFRPAGSPQLCFQQGLLVFGREAKLGSSRAHSPCPRPAVNRLASRRVRGRMKPLQQLELTMPTPASRTPVAYMPRRRQPAGSLQGSRHSGCRSRSHLWVAAADIRARWHGSRPPLTLHSSASSSAASPVVLQNDIVPRIMGADMERQAQQYAAVVGVVSRCVVEQDHQGRVVAPLPEGCTGAGCRASSTWTCSSSTTGSGQQQQQVCCASGADALQWNSRRAADHHAAAGCGRNRHRNRGRAAAVAGEEEGGEGGGGGIKQTDATTPAAVAEQLRERQLDAYNNNINSSYNASADPGAQQVHGSHSFSSDVPGRSIQHLQDALRLSGVPFLITAVVQDEAYSDAEDQVPSDSDWDTDDNEECVYDSDSDQDDQCIAADIGIVEEVELPVALKAAIAEPFVFRNSRDIIYGFWSKCPMG